MKWCKVNKFSQRDSLNEYYLDGYILFQYEWKGTEGKGVFVYGNKVLKQNEMVSVNKRKTLSLCGLKLFVKMVKKLLH